MLVCAVTERGNQIQSSRLTFQGYREPYLKDRCGGGGGAEALYGGSHLWSQYLSVYGGVGHD